MADYLAETLVEEREDVMHPPNSGNPTFRNAHFLKPVFKQHLKHLPPPKPTFQEMKRYKLRSHKGHSSTVEKMKKCRLRSYKGQPSEKWKLWVDKLKPKYQEIWKQAGIYEAILASTYVIPNDKSLIIGLAERWCGETNTFVFPWGEVSITLEDVIYLGNYSVLGDSFSTPLADELVGILNCLKKVYLKAGRSNKGKVRASVWMKYNMCRGNQLEHEAFLAMWLSQFVFVCSDIISVQHFCVAIHLSRGTRIALAPVVLASIYRDLRLLNNSIVESVKLDSVVGLTCSMNHYDLVQMWAWERFPELRPTPSVTEKGEPRLARWNGATILNVEDTGEVLDSGKESFVWRPYSITPSNCVLSKLYKDNEQWLVVESDDQESFARCLSVSELVGLGYTEQYSPHRVAMQFGLDQDVPANVIRSNQSPETVWSSYNRSIRGMKLYIPPRQFESDISSRYVVWWRGLLVGNEELVTNCIQNEKQLPLTSYRQKKDANFLASTGWLFGCAVERPKDSLAIDQLMSRRRKTESSGRSNDLESVLNTFSKIETPAKVICRTEPVGHVTAVNEGLVTDCIQNEKQLPLVFYRRKKNAIFLTSTGCAADRPVDNLAIEELMSSSRMTESSGRKNDHELVLHTFSSTEIPTEVICTTEPVGHILAVNEETVTGGIHNEKYSLLVSCGHKGDAHFLTSTSCHSGCAAERPEDSLAIDQLMSHSRTTESSGRRNDYEPVLNTFPETEIPTEVTCMTEPVGHVLAVNEETVTGGIQNEKHSPLVSCGHKRDAKSLTTPHCVYGCAEERLEDDEEDSLTIAQLLRRSKKTDRSMKRNDLGDEPLPNICSKIETPTKLIFKTEPVESSARSLPSSGNCKSSESPAESQKESEAKKGAVVSEANTDYIKLTKEEVVSEANTVKIEEENYDNTASASELPQLGLKARIWRLETIIDMIKAEKNVAGSREI